MNAFLDADEPGTEETLAEVPLWRHAGWVAGVAALGVGLGWAGSLFRFGPDEYGLPPAAPGSPWPYLGAWFVVGVAAAAVLRAASARVPVYATGRIAVGLAFLGTRVSLGRRPEAGALTAMAVAALAFAVLWAAFALRGRRGTTST
ncbi:hypothetical protein [Streptomyces sp. NPDC053755]|uniref:hypothetical protein n=1 Tax=Streptomyces sp. NPDC053755 TaxID=3155815 RepID=UPI0034200868